MDLLQTVLITVVTLGILVAVHEYGHFIVARRCGVRVLRFSIGFGKPLWRRTGRDGTEYVIAAVPLGGYVKMLDEREGDVPEEELPRTFNRQPVGRRMAIVAAGPLANFLLAILAFYVLYMIGVPGLSPVIGSVRAGSVAEHAGLEAGQEIIAVDGVPTGTRQAVTMHLLERLGETGTLQFTVRYADSTLAYESSAPIEDWLQGIDEPDVIDGLGIGFVVPPIEPLIGEVIPDSAAARAGMLAGDRVLSVDGVPMQRWEDWLKSVRGSAGKTLVVEVERGGSVQRLSLTPARVTLEGGEVIGQVGVSVDLPEWPEEYRRTERYGPLAAWGPALDRTWGLAAFTVAAARKMVTGEISSKNLSGPITIAKVAAASARSGLEAYISLIALLSISLGVLNLFPVPALDGGHLLYGLIEWVKGSPVSERVQMLGYQAGLFVLVGVMMLAFYNDINRLLAN